MVLITRLINIHFSLNKSHNYIMKKVIYLLYKSSGHSQTSPVRGKFNHHILKNHGINYL